MPNIKSKSVTLKFKYDEWVLLEKIAKERGFPSVYSFIRSIVNKNLEKAGSGKHSDLDKLRVEIEQLKSVVERIHVELSILRKRISELEDVTAKLQAITGISRMKI